MTTTHPHRTSPGAWAGLLSIGLGITGAVWFATATLANRPAAADVGLGVGTQRAMYTAADGTGVHCGDLGDAQVCLEGAAQRALPHRLLWLGASQLHGMNDPQPGDMTAPARLFEALRGRGVDVLTFSQPNSNFQEQLVLFEWLRPRLKPQGLILPAVFDDMREVGVRSEIAQALSDPDTANALARSEIGRMLSAQFRPTANGSSDNAALHQTDQERVELALNGWLEQAWPLWRQRGELRSQAVLALHDLRKLALRLRNAVLSIDSSKWQVAIPQAQYDINHAALEAMLASARAADVPVLIYIAPRPIDAHFPYDPARYAAFKQDMAATAARHGAALVNLEDSVRGDVWGKIDNGVGVLVTDVFHFRNAGHAQMAGALQAAVEATFGGMISR